MTWLGVDSGNASSRYDLYQRVPENFEFRGQAILLPNFGWLMIWY